jgi:hypothetical protein
MSRQMRFLERLKIAWQLLIDQTFAEKVQLALEKEKPAPERVHASGLMLLAALQREGRLIDFLRQDIAAFSDEEVGAAARIVHSGSRKVLEQFFVFEPAVKGQEGMLMSVPPGFDAQRIRLTGNVTGQPPFKGTLKHHGWFASTVRMPEFSDALDPRVIAPAEVELP